ncbi:hypothetical protein [Pseudomonas sp. B21-010]|uniref:hypothetical protein n=1 Tax=Pseudomonas sp. B21-010 TaxID=2895471 RepID=UPI002160B3CE|nr:hypothetical protein [Pseudomonas sp. B21-010]UVM59094.1 hypothetical protein LOY50_16155 [Pseudomonas sp. B21-010]
MPDVITLTIQKQIAKMIREWPQKESLTWKGICSASQFVLGYEPTRQALANKPMIVSAYKTKKDEVQSHINSLATIAVPKSLPAAIEQILRLTEENKLLEAQLSEMAEMANLIIHNAINMHGLSPSKLMAPLPTINRKE